MWYAELPLVHYREHKTSFQRIISDNNDKHKEQYFQTVPNVLFVTSYVRFEILVIRKWNKDWRKQVVQSRRFRNDRQSWVELLIDLAGTDSGGRIETSSPE